MTTGEWLLECVSEKKRPELLKKNIWRLYGKFFGYKKDREDCHNG